MGTTLFFLAAPLDGWRAALWKSDGTSSGTVAIRAGDQRFEFSAPGWLTPMGSTLYFSAYDPARGWGLWKTDGTDSNTVLVRNVNSTVPLTPPQVGELAAGQSLLYFSADDGIHGRELWESDGTASGTFLLKDIKSGPSSSNPEDLTQLGSVQLFYV